MINDRYRSAQAIKGSDTTELIILGDMRVVDEHDCEEQTSKQNSSMDFDSVLV